MPAKNTEAGGRKVTRTQFGLLFNADGANDEGAIGAGFFRYLLEFRLIEFRILGKTRITWPRIDA
jgi:hypothetical protein